MHGRLLGGPGGGIRLPLASEMPVAASQLRASSRPWCSRCSVRYRDGRWTLANCHRLVRFLQRRLSCFVRG